MKRCTRCRDEKPLAEFYRQKTTKDGRGSWCKVCQNQNVKEWRAANHVQTDSDRDRAYRHKYKLSVVEYEELLAAQGGVCAICSIPPGKRRLHVDHDHATGKVRGILCNSCNTGLGHFRDDPVLLDLARRYLTQPMETASSPACRA
jgi:hypothetical protein